MTTAAENGRALTMENKFGFVLAWLSLWVLAYYSASASPVLVPKNERLLIQPVEAPDTRDLCFLPPGMFTTYINWTM